MQSVIAGYEHLAQAARAVHRLERVHSIQDMFVADTEHPAWRGLHPDREQAARYLVVMIGRPEVTARARSILEREERG
jgi:hypothetical protein